MAGLLSLVAASLFTGAAIYINVAEQPARLALDDVSLLREWAIAYERGQVMQASLAILGFMLAAIAWWQTGRPAYLLGGLVLLANWPFTVVVIMPVNRALKALPAGGAGSSIRSLVQRWGRLHAVRSVLGGVSVSILLGALAT
ncbi:DUF1772 domain-containing protein [uncultured Enterovirga sp.]|uniref:DUF1772 domain-containing protein n=1 Tax=uncultured Enterovirga sp. TaxID=2026352 RepID=UPI0035CB86F5